MLLSAAMALPTFAAGWQRDGRGWWYQYADGHYAAGQWEQMQGSWYYFDTDGYMATGWRQIDGKWYYLSSSGEMLRNTTTPDGYRVGIDGRLPDDAGMRLSPEPGIMSVRFRRRMMRVSTASRHRERTTCTIYATRATAPEPFSK